MAVIGEGAGTVVSGQRTLAAIGASRKKPQFTGELINISANCAPLYLLIKKLGNSKSVGQASYFHLETDWLPTVVTDSGSGATNSDTTINVTSGHGTRVTVGTLLKVLRTQEIIRVTAVATDALTVVRGVAGTSGTAINASEEIAILAFADTEGNTSPNGQSSEPTLKTNYCQVFRQALELSGRDLNSDVYGTDEYQRIKKDAAEAIMQKMEKAFFFQNGTASSDPTITGGCENWISTNVTNVGGTLTETTLIDSFVRPWFRRNQGVKNMVCYAGELFCRAVDGFGRDMIRYTPDEDTIGIAVSNYRSSFGEFKILRHQLFTPIGASVTAANLGWQGMAFGLNMDNVGKRVFNNREMQLLKNRQTPDKDGIKEEYLSDEGFYMSNEASHAELKGITG